jgi:hypothetical protein
MCDKFSVVPGSGLSSGTSDFFLSRVFTIFEFKNIPLPLFFFHMNLCPLQ